MGPIDTRQRRVAPRGGLLLGGLACIVLGAGGHVDPPAAPPGPAIADNAMTRVVELMEASRRRLVDEADPTEPTQAVQAAIIDALDDAIVLALTPGQSAPPSTQSKTGQPTMAPPTPAGQTGEPGREPAPNAPPSAGRVAEHDRDDPGTAGPGRAWGHLPRRDREEIMQGARDQILEEYREQIEQYYRALAEQDGPD